MGVGRDLPSVSARGMATQNFYRSAKLRPRPKFFGAAAKGQLHKPLFGLMPPVFIPKVSPGSLQSLCLQQHTGEI
jgi:hypothetical protein